MVRCRKQHKGKEKVVRARGKRMHRARTAWCTARTALTSPSMELLSCVDGADAILPIAAYGWRSLGVTHTWEHVTDTVVPGSWPSIGTQPLSK